MKEGFSCTWAGIEYVEHRVRNGTELLVRSVQNIRWRMRETGSMGVCRQGNTTRNNRMMKPVKDEKGNGRRMKFRRFRCLRNLSWLLHIRSGTRENT